MHHAEPVAAIVVAAGSGVRLGGGVPKALRLLAGAPLVVHAGRRLLAGGVTRLMVVVPAMHAGAFDAALADGLPEATWRTVPGGAERQESVRAGLAALAAQPDPPPVVLIHDAARPLVPPEVVARVIAAVRAGSPAVIPVVAVVDTVRQVRPGGSTVIDRAALRAVQTPQGFDRVTVTTAHELVARDGVRVTDDAAVCEYAGYPVTVVEGSRRSLKITEPEDLTVALALLESSAVER